MNRRKATASICMLCALAFSAIAAQGASAVTGTTLFTCAKMGSNEPTGEKFSKAHCKDADTSPLGEYRHWDIEQGKTTHLTATSENTNAQTNGPTPSKLKATVGGVSIRFSSNQRHATGTIKNLLDPTGEHYFEGNEITITYTGVTENKLGCEVYTDLSATEDGEKGVIHTLPLKMTSTGQGDSVLITPENANEEFAHFRVKKCAAEGTYKLIGSLTCKPDGATINCNHEEVTTQGKLRLNSKAGPKAGIEGSMTVLAGEGTAGEGKPTNPLSVTTVTT